MGAESDANDDERSASGITKAASNGRQSFIIIIQVET